MDVREAVQEFLHAKLPLSRQTQRGYRIRLKLFVVWCEEQGLQGESEPNMARKAQNEPILLHPEQENEQKQVWQRLPDEPAHWFLRFQRYCLLGRGRSLGAVLAQEKGLLSDEEEHKEAPLGAELENISLEGASLDEQHFVESVQRDQVRREEQNRIAQVRGRDLAVVVPGSWKRASSKWQWVKRAQAFDEMVRGEYEKDLLGFLDHEGLYISKSQRLAALDMLASALMITIHRLPDKHALENDMKPYLAVFKQIQSILRDIRKEMSTIDLALVRKDGINNEQRR